MSVGAGVDGALKALAASRDRPLDTASWGGDVLSNLLEWGGQHGLHSLPVNLFHRLRQEPKFDTLGSKMGTIWWPPLISTGEIPVVVGLTRTDADELCIRIGLFRFDDGKPRAIGLRFETPHANSDRHEFHHAQLWTYIRKGDDASRIVDSGAWIPEEQPSFPLQAKNPLELLWAAAVTIYGKRDASRPFESDPIEADGIAKYLRGLGK